MLLWNGIGKMMGEGIGLLFATRVPNKVLGKTMPFAEGEAATRTLGNTILGHAVVVSKYYELIEW